MKYKLLNKIIQLLIVSFFIISCTEQYALQTNTFENALVVEATITNELKKQEIKITRTYRLEEEETTIESGAKVTITDNENNKYDFDLKDSIYVSRSEFQAIPGKKYRLDITTNQGKSYYSTSETLTTVNEIQSIDATVTTVKNDRGVQINVKNFDPTGTSKYYRYEYEETYKVIAPQWVPFTATATYEPQQNTYSIQVKPRVDERKTCYSTIKSNSILITTTGGLTEDRVNFPIRFISNKNYIISHRYSILIHQYIQSLEAYTYYKTLKKTSSSQNLLSQNQPGFFFGNIKSIDAPNEKVIGFFEVTSVSSKRIYFNYSDLFPNEPLPPFYNGCPLKEMKFCFDSNDPACQGSSIVSYFQSQSLIYAADSGMYYYLVEPPCGDCTTISSNIKPAFWID
jgi:hypothetical protein